MSKNDSEIGFISLLTISFIIAKLLGIIKWSWWWVFSPVWIILLINVILVVLAMAIAEIVVYMIKK